MSLGILEPPRASKKLIYKNFFRRLEAHDEFTRCLAIELRFFAAEIDLYRTG